MKRNHVPSEECEWQADKEIVNERLDELFSHSVPNLRFISRSNNGNWISGERHVRVDSTKGLPSGLLSYSTQHKYYFLNPFEALFCLEAKQLLISYNSIPLSLAECYQLLIQDEVEYRNYNVFQHLNRSGHICLKHLKPEIDASKCSKIETTNLKGSHDTITKTNTHEPLFRLESAAPPSLHILRSLRLDHGPKVVEAAGYPSRLKMAVSSGGDGDIDTAAALGGGGSGFGIGGDGSVDITFDVYKRETFARNKPRKGKQGNPDYHVIVCEQSVHGPPNWKQLLLANDLDLLGASGSRDERGSLSEKILYALVNDNDNSICFNQFQPIDPLDMIIAV